MKRIAYLAYGVIFNIFRICPIRKKKVVFFMIHNCKFKGNFNFIYNEMKKKDQYFEFIFVSKKQLFNVTGNIFRRVFGLVKGGLYFYFILNYHLATAEFVFLNDNFQPLAFMNISRKTKLIQLWHGIGAFKRFGLSTETDPLIRECTIKGNKKITHLFVSSMNVVPFYIEAMGVDKNYIFPTGLPVADFYFMDDKKIESRIRFESTLNIGKDKKVLLYTPTFRNTEDENIRILQAFDCEAVLQALGEEWIILIRLHPQMYTYYKVENNRVFDVTHYDDIKDLFVVADVLISDYSSTIVEYSLLHKPMYFYAYDLDKYDRGFYLDYLKNLPGPIAYTLNELILYIQEGVFLEDKWKDFVNMQYDYLDKSSTQRVLDIILQEG